VSWGGGEAGTSNSGDTSETQYLDVDDHSSEKHTDAVTGDSGTVRFISSDKLCKITVR
jgi:hypothetical protein